MGEKAGGLHGSGAGFLATLDGGMIYSVRLTTSILFKNVCGILGTSNCCITRCVTCTSDTDVHRLGAKLWTLAWEGIGFAKE